MSYDAVVVGSGPNGLAAAITLAEAGCKVLVLEARETVGGGTRSAELTLPGFHHDVCSAIHPLTVSSSFFRRLDLAQYGLRWVYPEVQMANPFDGGEAAALFCSIAETGDTLGLDAGAYARMMEPLVADWPKLAREFLGPLRVPRYPLAMMRFGLQAILPATRLAMATFEGQRARGLYTGLAAHSIMALDKPGTAAFGLILGVLGHAVGWPMPRGGAQQIADALAAHLTALGGEITTGMTVHSLDELPPAPATLLDVSPRSLATIAGDRLSAGYRRQLARYRYGPGVFKIDWALDEPIPWEAEACRRAGTVHVGGTMAEVVASERMVWDGKTPERPYVLVAQPTLFDASRAPEGKHIGWAYCHVPNGCSEDMTERIEAQIERFAPGFRDCILARRTHNAVEMERYNPNYVGGDINSGVQDLAQLWTRPALRLNPYRTPADGVYICSSATPPGGGVHGMCGAFAARTALRDCF